MVEAAGVVDPLEVAEVAAAAVVDMEIEIEEAVGKHNEKELHFKIPLNMMCIIIIIQIK